MSVPATTGGRFVWQQPEPARFWIAHAPRRWTATRHPWTDLAASAVRRPRSDVPVLWPAPATRFDDLVYLPPVDAEHAPARDRLVAALAADGVAVLVQLRPDDQLQVQPTTVVVDLLEPLLGGLDGLAESLRAGTARGEVEGAPSVAAWPLIAGRTDDPALWREGCRLLAGAGFQVVQAVGPELDADVRAWLAQGQPDSVFDALFHGAPPDERQFARIADSAGLAPLTVRPETGRSVRVRSNRALAASLALAGELWLRQDRSVAVGQSLLRAARGADSTPHDLRGLALDGNLRVVDWLSEQARQVIEERLRSDRSVWIDRLRDEYLGRGSGGGESSPPISRE